MNNSKQLICKLLSIKSYGRILPRAYASTPDKSDNKDVSKVKKNVSKQKQKSHARVEREVLTDKSTGIKAKKSKREHEHANFKSKSGAAEQINTEIFEGKDSVGRTGGFFAAYKKQERMLKEVNEKPQVPDETFAALLRNSSFVEMGNPVGKYVAGEVFLIVDNDLYIDFNWKFHVVCPKPRHIEEEFSIGTRVLVRIKDLELSARFLGDERYTSLNEADGIVTKILSKKEKTS